MTSTRNYLNVRDCSSRFAISTSVTLDKNDLLDGDDEVDEEKKKGKDYACLASSLVRILRPTISPFG